ncbi:MAG TPA: hypothetical protein VKV95_15135 [Terriglobia bacterium]|nr:hypothetical protein [Terriglobia bacterium]
MATVQAIENPAPHHPDRRGAVTILAKVFSFPVFMGAVLSAGAAAATVWNEAPIMAGKLFGEGDTWWHLTYGQSILATHTWPRVEIYSFTAHGVSVIAYEWGGEVIMALAYRLGSLRGLAALLVLLAISFVLLMFYYAWLRCRNPLAAAVAAAMLTPVASACFTMRPQLLGYTFFLVTLIFLERYKQGLTKSLWLLPLLFLVWVNTHPSETLGLFALGLYWACGLVSFKWGPLVAERFPAGRRRHLLLVSLACAVVIMVTPYGPSLAAYPFEFILGRSYVTWAFTEWGPLDFSAPFGWMFLAIILLMLVSQWSSPASFPIEAVILLLAGTAEASRHARFVIFFAVVSAPVLASLLSKWLPTYRPDEDHPIANAVLVGAVILGLVAFFPSRLRLQQTLEDTFPVGAVDYIRQHDSLNHMFNDETWGGFLMLSIGPTHQVFMDGRDEIYTYNGVIEDYIRIVQAQPGALDLFRKYGINGCLIRRTAPLGKLLSGNPEWKQVYCDDLSVIFDRVEQRMK